MRYDELNQDMLAKVAVAVASHYKKGALQKIDHYEETQHYYYIRYEGGKVGLRYHSPFARIEILAPAEGQEIHKAPTIGWGHVSENGKIDFEFLEKRLEV